MNLNKLDIDLLNTIAGLTKITNGAINIRSNGKAIYRASSPNIAITSLPDKPGILVDIKPGTRNEMVHVPVILTDPGFQDVVYNTFIVGEGADVTIVAGCGIHNSCSSTSQHDGIHTIIVKPGAKLKYVEKHYGEGTGKGKRVLNPTTLVTVEEGAYCEMEMVQIKGVDDTLRTTEVHVHEKGNVKIIERLLTQGKQQATSDVKVYLEGRDSSGQVLSRSVAQENSYQEIRAMLSGQAVCLGHVECNAIIMDQARVHSIPGLLAEDTDAVLTHEAAIGKIAGEQLIKLMSLGLTEKEAVDTILRGFLRS